MIAHLEHRQRIARVTPLDGVLQQIGRGLS